MTRKISDFLCAFIISSIVFVSIALLTANNLTFIEIRDIGGSYNISIFKNAFRIDKISIEKVLELIRFNSVIFSKPVYDIFSNIFIYLSGFAIDAGKLAFELCLMAVGGV